MNEKTTKALEAAQPTYSQRFTLAVMKEFGSTVGGKLELSPYKQTLAQHLFIGVDNALRDLEANRLKKGQQSIPMVWANINMNKLAIDAVHRVELGLDALIPGHIYPIPYLNGKTGRYDLDLRIGYIGKDLYRREMATEKPLDIIYQLVHKKDVFRPIMTPGAESYELEITDPFDRGEVVGGFGYILYADSKKNKLVLVSKADFDKSKKKSGSDKFWGPYEKEMQFKTLVNRVTSKLAVDPKKVNSSYAQVEVDEAQEASERDIEQNANQEIIDVEPEQEVGTPLTEEEKAEILAQEQAEAEKEGQAQAGGPDF
uniref:Putative DNA recombination protein n=1 Tax=viral metagenome TaxID=1070528 RepID=A0A6M3LKF6_9ZZZZ